MSGQTTLESQRRAAQNQTAKRTFFCRLPSCRPFLQWPDRRHSGINQCPQPEHSFSEVATVFSQKAVFMHVISRQQNETIVINNDILVTVLEVNEDWVRLGIQSPGETPSYREEVIHLEPQLV